MSATGHSRDLDRCSETNRDQVGVGHVAKVHDPETPQVFWKARRGWTLGSKACLDGKAWRIPKAVADLALAAGA